MQISLSGNDWHCRPFNAPYASSHAAQLADPNLPLAQWFSSSVPGSPYADLAARNELPNPYVATNSRLCEWVAARSWVFRKMFYAPRELEGRHVELLLEGVDLQADVYLNGQRLGQHTGQFVPARFDTAGVLRFDEPNVLVIGIHRAPDEESQFGYTNRVRTHKTRMAYGWDFCGRLVGIGIWDDVSLVATGPARLRDPWARARYDAARGSGRLEVAAEVEGEAGELACTVRLRGREVARASATASGQATLVLELDAVEPWWPNGYGAQALYDVELVLSVGGQDSDRRTVRAGFRTIEAVPTDGAPKDARPYALVVNGRPMPIRGWNWVPPDVQYGLPMTERYRRLIALAREAHVNLLRVWGGGLIEKELFYDCCDEAGILIWQEFILSSSGHNNEPSTDPAYQDLLRREAPPVIRKRRNHPALAIWCGGNELQADGAVPLDESHPTIALLAECVREHDPDRIFLPTSASGPYEFLTPEAVRDRPGDLHDVHGPWDYSGPELQYTLYNASPAMLHSEFGTPGGAHPEALALFMPLPACWPPDPEQRDWNNHGEWWTRSLVHCVPQLFGPLGGPEDAGRFLLTGQWLQYEGLRYALEANRRRGRRCAGTMPWQFNEPWPNAACTSAVDWFTQPKAGYDAVRDSYRPIHASLKHDALARKPGSRFEAELWFHADPVPGADPGEITIELGGFDLHGHAVPWLPAMTYTRRANRLTDECIDRIAAEIPADWHGVFILQVRLAYGQVVSPNTYAFSTDDPPLAELAGAPRTTLSVAAEGKGNTRRLMVRNTGPVPAWWVRVYEPRPDTVMPLDPNAHLPASLFSDNYAVLLPGESWPVSVTTWGPDLSGRPWRVQGWNTEVAGGVWG